MCLRRHFLFHRLYNYLTRLPPGLPWSPCPPATPRLPHFLNKYLLHYRPYRSVHTFKHRFGSHHHRSRRRFNRFLYRFAFHYILFRCLGASGFAIVGFLITGASGSLSSAISLAGSSMNRRRGRRRTACCSAGAGGPGSNADPFPCPYHCCRGLLPDLPLQGGSGNGGKHQRTKKKITSSRPTTSAVPTCLHALLIQNCLPYTRDSITRIYQCLA